MTLHDKLKTQLDTWTKKSIAFHYNYNDGVTDTLRELLDCLPDWILYADMETPNVIWASGKHVLIPEYIYVPTEIKLPPNGERSIWMSQTYEVKDYLDYFRCKELYGTFFLDSVACQRYVENLNKEQ